MNRLNVASPENDFAHQEYTETDECRHGVNERLAHEPALSGRIISGQHAAASNLNATGSETIETIVYPLLMFSRTCLEFGERKRSGKSENDRR